MEIVFLLLGMPLGILASLLAWWVLFHWISPSIDFSAQISKLPDPSANSGYKYRVKIKNAGRRDVIDVQLVCRYYAKGLLEATPSNTSIIKIKLSTEAIPYIKSGGADKLIQLYPEKVDDFSKSFFSSDIRLKSQEDTLLIEDILEVEDSFLELVIFAYDEYSGSRKIFVSNHYRLSNIQKGKFEKSTLKIFPAKDF